MGAVLQFTQKLETQPCARCGIIFAVPGDFIAELRRSKGNIYCPAGHQLVFSGPTEAERLKEQLAAKERELSSTAYQLKNVRDLNEKLTKRTDKAERKLHRAKNGVCPCCRRSFTALRRHMATKHPEWKPSAEPKP